MKKVQETTHFIRFYFHPILPALLLTMITIALALLPTTTTPVNPNVEDMKKYMAIVRALAEKTKMQNTLAIDEWVMQVYADTPKYFQVTDTCDWSFTGTCVPIRSGPGMSYPQAHLYYAAQGPHPQWARSGQVFRMSALVKGKDGSLWYKIIFDKSKMGYPQRIRTDWYVPAEHFVPVDFLPTHPDKDPIKRIVIILHEQALYAYEGDEIFLKTSVSTGRKNVGLSTSTGHFQIYRKTPMTIMDGPLPGMAHLMNPATIADFEYTLFVPYAMAFNPTWQGTAFIHQAYWHNGFGSERSHGCVNVSPQDALTLYNWVPDPSSTKIPVTVLP